MSLPSNTPAPNSKPRLSDESKNLLRNLIDQSLMVQKAKDEDVNVETDIIKRLDQMRKQDNLATIEDLQKDAEQQGVNWEDFKDQIRRQLLMQEVISRDVGSRIVVTREELRQYYNQHKDEFKSEGMVHLAEILISTEKYKPEEAEKRAKAALAELKGGAKFSEVVKKYSDDPSADQGGDISLHEDQHPCTDDRRGPQQARHQRIYRPDSNQERLRDPEAPGTFQPRHPHV